MGNISTYLQQIMNAVYGEQVRSAIHDAINQCYIDASAGITPTITVTPVDGGTRVDIAVGADIISFVVQNGTATTQEVQYYVTEWLEENPDFYTTEVELLSGYIDDLATTGTYTKKNFYRCTSGRNSGTAITENSKQAYVVLTQEEATAHSIIYDNSVYAVEVIKVRDGSVISQSIFVTTSPVSYLDGTYDTAIINFKRQDEADLTAMERRLTLFYESSVGGLALASDLDDKVDKVTGKGLSTEDYTTAEKTKLEELTQIEVDDTLSGKGRAADAKVTGDKISQIQTGIVLLESGTYADGDGITKRTNNTKIRNAYPLAVNGITKITIPGGYEAWIFRLDSNFRLLGTYGNWVRGNILISNISIADMEYITFAIEKISEPTSDISDQVETVQSGMSIERKYDALSEQQNECAEMIETGGYTYRKIAQGSYNNSGVLTYYATRVRMERFLPVSAGTMITIDPGSLNKAYTVWKDSVAIDNVVKTTSFTAGIENVEIADDGYFIVAFAYPDNRDIVPSDFDGSITVFDSLPYRNKTAIEAISATYELPEYYTANNYIQNKAARINELGKSSDDVFIFITDVHWERNAKISPALINYLMKNCNISKVFSGGDISDTAKMDAINAYNKAAIGEVHYAVGNHEWFPPETGKSLYYAVDYDKNNQYGHFSSHYWYYDNVQAKIRYVVLNAFKHAGSDLGTGWEYGFDADQIAWFENTALNVEEGYDVVVITHYFGTNSYKITGSNSIESIINDFNTNSGTGKVLFIVEGHRHWDAVFNNGPVPCVLTTCDKYDVSNESTLAEYVREKGTLTEQAFDVCCINRDTMSATFVRIGARAMDNNDVSIGESGFTFDETLEERTITMG